MGPQSPLQPPYYLPITDALTADMVVILALAHCHICHAPNDLPGSAITHCIISLFITIVAAVLGYCGYSTVVVKATAIANLSRAIYQDRKSVV